MQPRGTRRCRLYGVLRKLTAELNTIFRYVDCLALTFHGNANFKRTRETCARELEEVLVLGLSAARE